MIYAYYRVSSADQNYNSQKLGVEEYCKRCGYHIDKEFIYNVVGTDGHNLRTNDKAEFMAFMAEVV